MAESSYDPKNLPPGVRAFLTAISVWPDIGDAAHRAAEALHPPVQPPILAPGGLSGPGKAEREAAATAQRAREARRAKLVEKLAERIRCQHKRREKDDPAYKAAFDEAWELGREGLQDRAVKRATLGWDEPVFQGGMLVGYKHKVSDSVLLRTLETFYPETWGKRKMEHEHSGSLKLGVGSLSDEELESRIAAGEQLIARLSKRDGGDVERATEPQAAEQ
jgi:hypothetical protein